MEEGLAARASNMYGDGSQNTTTHYYAGEMKSKKKKGSKMACKSKGKGKGKK